MEALDKQIESRLHRVMKSNGDDGSADEIFENLCDAFVKKQIEEKDFEEYVRDLLDESSYVDFLINCGLKEKSLERV